MSKKLSLLSLVILTLSSMIGAFAPQPASALSGSDFKAGRIIDDALFFNGATMSATEVQAFLNSKVPECDTQGDKAYGSTTRRAYAATKGVSPPFTCLKDYRQNTPSRAGESGLCGALSARTSRSAALIIDDVSRACGVSQKALIVLLQKEQSLITDDWPWPIQYRSATGYGCPDTAPCDSEYYGFFNQVYNAARQFKRYGADPTYFNFRAGRNNFIQYNPVSSCGGSNVYVENQATAGLYNYTPYQPNSAALSNLYGSGNSCSAYGNRNFWRMYNDWFGPTTGTPFFRFGTEDAVYVLGSDNNYYHIPSSETLDAYGWGRSVTRVMGVKWSYVSGRTFSGELPHIARFEGSEIYQMSSGNMHHYTSRSLLQEYGKDVGQEALLPQSTKLYFKTSETMQQVARSSGGTVFYVDNGKRRHIINPEAYASGSPAYNSLDTVTLSDPVINSVPSGAPILTANKVLKRQDKVSYVYWDGSARQDIAAQTVNDLGLSVEYGAPASVINQLPASGNPVTKLAKNGSGQLFIFDQRQRYLVGSGDLAELNLTSDSFELVSNALLSEAPTIKTFRRIVRINDNAEVYVIEDGQRSHLTSPAAVTDKGFDIADTISINDSTARLFPDSGKKILSLGSLFKINNDPKVQLVNDTGNYVHVASPAVFRDFGLSSSAIRNYTPSNISNYLYAGKLGFMVKDSNSDVWLVQTGNVKRPVPEEMREAGAYNAPLSSIILFSDSALTRYQTIDPLTKVIQAPRDPKVYEVSNGQKRWLTSRAALSSRGYSTSSITSVSSGFVESLPTGSNLN
ncbi:hypothetical protein KA047_03935 [Candidatus Saccharibacteria bacterium]|nr:hypothetical protein [Candidatus Saccharibacteria bacterium]